MLAYRWIAILALPWALGSLSACSSLPTLVPDMAHSHAPVRLIGPGGPLSPARSQAIIGSLKASGVETNIFDLHLAVEQAIVGSPLTAGNRVELLQDGRATYRSMKRLARRVTISTWRAISSTMTRSVSVLPMP